MTPSPFAQLRALSAESFRDAVRRRIAGALVVLALLSLLVVESCTSCARRDLRGQRPARRGQSHLRLDRE